MLMRRGRRTMFLMRWVRGHVVTTVLLSLIVGVLGLDAMAWATSPVRRGATYDGRGRQPHFSLAGARGGPSGNFILQFRVTRNGRPVTQLYVWDLAVACARTGGYMQPSPEVGSARIRATARSGPT